MRNAKHTAGPWVIGRYAHSAYRIDGSGKLVVASVFHSNKANALLIAAAPDLLAKSEALLDELEASGVDTGMGGAASDLRDEIAKAKGER